MNKVVHNETTTSSQNISGIYLPKIIKIGPYLTKLRQLMIDEVFFDSRCILDINFSPNKNLFLLLISDVLTASPG